MLPAAFKHLGVTILLRVTTAISYSRGSLAASERSMADAQPFYSTSMDADYTAQVYVLFHSWPTLRYFSPYIGSFCWLLPELCSHDSTTCSVQTQL